MVKLKDYSLTLKYNKHPNPTRLDYMEYIAEILLKYSSTLIYQWTYETDSKNKIHLHAYVKSRYFPISVMSKKAINDGFWLHIDELKKKSDIQSWEKYLSKQRLTPEDCEQINIANEIYQMEYPFI